MKFSKFVAGTLLAMCGIFSTVQAQNACDPCNPCQVSNSCDLCDFDFCDTEFDFFVDALYWQRCRSDLDLAGNNGDVYINPDWHWGYRLAGYARFKSWDLGVRYTSFCHSDSRNGDGRAKHHFDLDVVDIEVGRTCCLNCGIMIRPVAGAKLAWIDDKFDKLDNNDDVKGKIDYKGYGLYLGMAGRWDLCSYCVCDRDIPLAIVTRCTSSILHGDFHYHLQNTSDRGDECLYNQVHELYVGLDMTFCDLCGFDAFMQVGYEAQYWDGWREWFSDEDIAHWGMGGLVLRFGASF